jgi:hypothetical protein
MTRNHATRKHSHNEIPGNLDEIPGSRPMTAVVNAKMTGGNMLKVQNERNRVARVAAGKIKAIVLYVIFMGFFTFETCQPLLDDSRYYFAENLKQQLINVEMLQQFSPTWGKNFQVRAQPAGRSARTCQQPTNHSPVATAPPPRARSRTWER